MSRRGPSTARLGPFLWGFRLDVAAFGGSAAAALSMVALGHLTGASQEPMPAWMFLAIVVAIDVAHVWSTLFRTYFDREEVRSRPVLYVGLPIACYLAGVALHAASPLAFWRALAYLAVFHFVRQQAGWVALYRARERAQRHLRSDPTAANSPAFDVDRLIDDAAIYSATTVPLFLWHTMPQRNFSWFVSGDFVVVARLAPWAPLAKAFELGALVLFSVRQMVRHRREGFFPLGKTMVVFTTAIAWWVGIVATDSDFDFTATNVLIHGVPYFVLLWSYAGQRRVEAPSALGSRIVRLGVPAFLALLLVLAFTEEMIWDRLVWHDHAALFGGDVVGSPLSSISDAGPYRPSLLLALLVPLLALPQSSHYLLDAFLWRRRSARPAQRRALGFFDSPTGDER